MSRDQKKTIALFEDTRGSSHAVGYAIMISIFLTGGFTMFFGGLTTSQQALDPTTWQALGSDATHVRAQVQDMHQGSTYREKTLSTTPISLSIASGPNVTVAAKSVDGTAQSGNCRDPGSVQSYPNSGEYSCVIGQSQIETFTYANERGSVVMSNGALFLKENRGGENVRQPPLWGVGENRFYFPLLNLEAIGPPTAALSAGGSDKMDMDMTRISTEDNSWNTDTDENPSLEVQVTLEDTSNPALWTQQANSTEGVTVVQDGSSTGTVIFTKRTDRVFVRNTTIGIELDD